MLAHVLVPLDGSELSEIALDYAHKVTAPNGKITLLSVVDLPSAQSYFLYDMPVGVIPKADDEENARKVTNYTREYLEKRASVLREEGFTVEVNVETGFPENAIVELARQRKVDAIIMSTHGRSGLSRLLFGSVTQRVLNAMPCPVLVVPPLVTETTPKEETAAVAY